MQPDAPSIPPSLSRFKRWVRHHPVWTYSTASVGLIVAGSLTTMAILWQPPEQVDAAPVAKKQAPKVVPKPVYYAPLTGEKVDDKTAVTKPVTAVMIENSPDARPQSGLKDAEVVYEAIAEGGITRFLALYQQHQPDLVGPVRSVRLYYVDWLTPYDASVAHVGGSKAALQLVRNGGYRDIDQFFNAAYYWRSSDRRAPHNVYTSFTKLSQLNTAKGYTTSNPKVFERTDDRAPSTQDATKISIHMSGPLYDSTYAYDASSQTYARSQAGAAHLDREAGQISAKVVIALRVDMKQVMEDGYRESIATTGNGQAIIFQNGHATKATWYKDDRAGQLRFMDESGTPIKLARGTTWISAVPNSGGDVSWQ